MMRRGQAFPGFALGKCCENIFIGMDSLGLRMRNQPGSQRPEFQDLQIALQGLARKIALGDAESGTLTPEGLVQAVRYAKR